MSGSRKAALLLLGVMGCQPAINSAPAPAAVSVRQVITMQALVGEQVTVTGTCLANGSAPIALGAPPHGGTWQIVQNGEAVWVSGPAPAGCSRDAAVPATITAWVMQDSLPRLSPARFRRQYLVSR